MYWHRTPPSEREWDFIECIVIPVYFFQTFLRTINACGLDMSTCIRQFYFVKMCHFFFMSRIMFVPEISRQEVWLYAQCFKKELIDLEFSLLRLFIIVCVCMCVQCVCGWGWGGGLSVCVCNAFFKFIILVFPFSHHVHRKTTTFIFTKPTDKYKNQEIPHTDMQYPFKTGKILQILDQVYCIKWVQSRYMRNGLLSIQFFCF